MDAWGFPPALAARPDDSWSPGWHGRGLRAVEGAEGAPPVDVRHGRLPQGGLSWLPLTAGTIPEGGAFTAGSLLSREYITEDSSTGLSTVRDEAWFNLRVPLVSNTSAMLSPHSGASFVSSDGYIQGSVTFSPPSTSLRYLTYALTWHIDVYGIEAEQDLSTLTWATRPTGDLLASLGSESISDGGTQSDDGGVARKYLSAFVVANPSVSKTYNTLRMVASIDTYSYSKPTGWTQIYTVAVMRASGMQQLDVLI